MIETSTVCWDHRCSHHVETNADGWADDVWLSDIEPNFTCTRCGKKGAELRPKVSRSPGEQPGGFPNCLDGEVSPLAIMAHFDLPQI